MRSLVDWFISAIVILTVGVLSAQQPPPPIDPLKAPVLTEMQELRLDKALAVLDAAQWKVQAAQALLQVGQAEVEKARTEATKVLQSLQHDGYDFDLNTRTFVKKKPASASGVP